MMLASSHVSESLGLTGCTRINDVNEHTGVFGIVHALSATVIAAITSGKFPNGQDVMQGTWTAVPLAAGDTIYGYFTAIQLVSGDVVVYNLTRP